MADLTDDILLQWLIKDPSWCLFYHRERVKAILPALAKSHILVTRIEQELKETQELLTLAEAGSDDL